jgi:hypothetical protein
MRRVYIAGRFEAQARLRGERDRLIALGLADVTSTWLDEENGEATAQQRLEYAIRDRHEVGISNTLFLDTIDENNRGGREVEFGIALALGLRVAVVGPRRNVFHTLAPAFENWDALVRALQEERR